MVIKNESTALESTYKKYNDIMITFIKLIILMLLEKCTKKDCLIPVVKAEFLKLNSILVGTFQNDTID